jgi:hypothetical protein
VRLRVSGLRSPVARLARTHPVRWLRWLRLGTLALILVAGLLCLLVTYMAHREITTATTRGAQAIAKVDAVSSNLAWAVAAVNVYPLTYPGAVYGEAIAAASQDLVLAAENNIDGVQGANDIQSAESLLIAYSDLIQQAGIDEATAGDAGLAATERAYASTLFRQPGGVLSAVNKLRQDERQAVMRDLGSGWLSPGDFWWWLLAPFLAMLLLAAATSYVLWHGFRRLLSVRLTAALALTLILVALAASLNVHDGGQAKMALYGWLASQAHPVSLSADDGFAFSPGTLAAGLVLLLGASLAAFAAFVRRLNEYRYRP